METSGRSGLVGQSVKRVEDDRQLRGNGTYVADVTPPGCLHATFVRSPFGHANIRSIDVAAAKKAPGVVAVYTGADMEKLTNPFVPTFSVDTLYTPLFYCLSSDKVRHVGDPVALVIAESRALGEDAAELVDVDYEPLDAVASIERALDPSSTPLWDKVGNNIMYDRVQTHGDVDAVFGKADRVITETFTCPRQTNQPMETNGIVVEVEKDGSYDVHAATQSSHALRWQLAAFTEPVGGFTGLRRFLMNRKRRKAFFAGFKQFRKDQKDALDQVDMSAGKYQNKTDRSTMPKTLRAAMTVAQKQNFARVLATDIGGGFGAKGAVMREDIAVTAAALDLNRSVKWVQDRVENLMDGGQAREENITLSMAVDNDGTIRGLKAALDIDQGAYPGNPIGAIAAVQIMRVMWPGSYRIEALELHGRIFATNKGRYIPYRGPWANETWSRERMINVVARELGLSQAEIRQKNMWTDDDYPAAMCTGPTLDVTNSTRKTLDEALKHVDFEAFAAEQAAAEARGHKLGLGIASYHEAAPGPPEYFDCVNPGNNAIMTENARMEVGRDGKVTVYTSQMPHGQSHETTYGQIAADQIGVSIDDVTLVYGDTSATPFSFLGTGGSRGGPVGGGAVRKVGQELRKKIIDTAADQLEASPADIEIVDGNVHVAGVPARGISLGDIVASAEPGTFEMVEAYTGAGDGGWSCATHVCWVDIDLATGRVDIPRYLVVEDCGPIINPAIVDGQVRGGVAQGVGAVLYECLPYDEDGNLQASTYMDYLIPTAMEIPEIDIIHLETLSPGENDYRGVGEGGMLGAPAAITNAVEDALGVTITEQYLPPTRILELAGVIEAE